MKQNIHMKFHSEALLEELEARQLFSGGIEGVLAENNEPEAAVYMNVTAESELLESSDSIATTTADSIRQELVFIDTDVENYQELLNDILNQGDEARNIEVILLDNESDGIEQISAALANYQNLDAVHLISHGDDGTVDIGNSQLNYDSLTQNLAEISAWGDAFSEDGDFLIYGCNLAETEVGQSLVQALSSLTHTDVAASDDLTGQAKLGGNWDLEFNTGTIETEIAISQNTQLSWNGVLDITTGLVGHWTLDNDGSDSSGNALNGTLSGNATIDNSVANQNIGAGIILLDGNNDFVDLSSSASSFDNLTEGTISGWIKTTDSTSTQTLFGVADQSDSLSFATLGVYQGNLFFDVAEKSSTNGYLIDVETTAFIADGNWHHIAVTVDATGNSLYVDGSKLTSADLTYYEGNESSTNFFADVHNVDAVQIGVTGEKGKFVYDLNGSADEVRIYDHALTATDINELYTGNAIPIISSDGSAATANINVAENQTSITTVTATDADLDTLSYSIIGGADSALFNIDPNSGVLAFNTAPNFENPVDDNTDNIYEVTVQSSDGKGGTDSQAISVTVTDINDAPALTAMSVNPTFSEDGAAVSLFSFVSPQTYDSGQTIEELVITVSNVNDGGNELINLDGSTFSLTNFSSGSTATNGYGYSVSLAGNTATLTLTTTGASTTDIANLFISLSYENSSEAPSTLDRVFTISSIKDSGGTANGGINISSPNLISTVTVVAVNDAPVLANGTFSLTTISEDDINNNGNTVGEIIASAGGDKITDVDYNSKEGIAITGTALVNGGMTKWQYSTDNGSSWNDIGSVSWTSALLLREGDRIRALPNSSDGTDPAGLPYISFRAWDLTNGNNLEGSRADTNLNGGTSAFSTAIGTAHITVSDVNDAPSGTDKTVTTSEDTDYIFTAADFGFTDVEGDALLNVVISAVPTNGTLYLDTNLDGIMDGAETLIATNAVSVADITAGKLKFQPVTDENGTGYDSFTFQVQDDGGTANSGVDTDQTANTITIDITAVNDVPVIAVLGGGVAYNENDPPVILSTTATVTDIDSTNFDGGTLSIGYVGTVSMNDVTGIRNQGSAAGEIGISGSDVTYGGTIIGTLSGNTPLVVTFNANADQASVQALVRNITYSYNGDYISTLNRTLRFTLTDGDGGTSTAVDQTVTLSNVNDPPINIIPGTQTVVEDTQTAISGISLDDPDALISNILTTQLSVSNGVLNVTLSGTVSISAGTNDSATLTLNGQYVDLITVLGTVKYTGNTNISGIAADTLIIVTNDGGNNGSGGAKTDTDSIQIDITAVNDAPVNSLPGSQSVDEDIILSIGGISVNDVDDNLSTVQLSVSNGSLNVTLSGAAIISTGTNDSNTLTLSGSQVDINTTLASLTYKGDTNFNGADNLIVLTTDNDAVTDTDTVAITVNAVNDAPTDLTANTVIHNIDANAITVIGSQTGSQLTTATLTSGKTVTVSVVGLEVYAQLANADGSLIGSTFRVLGNAADPALDHNTPSPVVVALPNGGFIVVSSFGDYIESVNSGEAIIAKVYDDAGNLITVGPQFDSKNEGFLISNSTAGNARQINATLDVAGDGTITVSWNNTTSGLFEQRSFKIVGPTVDENATTGTVVSTLTAVDPDSGDTKTYSIVGSDTNFEIVGDEVRVKAGAALDFETTQSYSITLRVTDSGGLTRDETFTIQVTNINEIPTYIDYGSSEFVVNTFAVNNQDSQDIAALSGGGFVVVWESRDQGELGDNVYFQRYDNSGNTVGVETLVTITTNSDQEDPVIKALPDGSFVIVWRSLDQDGSGYGIYGRHFDASGNPLGGEFQISTETVDDQKDPQITVLDSGGFVVVWESNLQDGDQGGIYSQLFDSSANPVGLETQVHTTTTGNQQQTSVSSLSDGGYVVVWESNDSGSNIIAQRFDASGVKLGSEIQANTTTTNQQDDAKVVGLSGGGFVVIWESDGQDGSGETVVGQLFNASGVAVGSEFIANTYITSDQMAPDILATVDGGFIITWESNGQDGDINGVFAQQYDASGTKINGEFQISLTIADNQEHARLAQLSNGILVATYQSNLQDGDGKSVVARILTPALDENSSDGTIVATVSQVLDPDNGDTFTYSLIDSAGGAFAINTSTGAISVNSSSLIDFETAASMNVTVQVTDSGANIHDQIVTIVINDVNDAATVSSANIALTETDVTLTSSGTLTSTDADNPDNTFTAQTIVGTIGTFTIDAAGAWDFTANSAFDSLNVGDNVNETFNITSIDGTASTVVITINGTDDAATVSSANIALTETDATLTSSGTLTSTDADNPDNTFTAQTIVGTIGTFTIDAAGAWDFTANSAFDNLSVDQSISKIFSVNSEDGTSSSVKITINGTNDTPVISGINIGVVQEDVAIVSNNISTTTGVLTITDADTGEASFQAGSIAGSYGSLIIDTVGNWTYTADNNQSAIQQLAQGETLTETITVSAYDGTSHNVVITLFGTDDVSVISGTTTGSVTEDGTLTATGILILTDTDTSDPTDFADVATTPSDNGYGSFEISANTWTYTVDNTHAAVQALDSGEALADSYTFIAPDGESQQISVTINGAADNPVVTTTQTFSVTEQASNGFLLGNAIANDVDSSSKLQHWTITAGNEDGVFAINAATGEITVFDNSKLDYESNAIYTLSLTVTDGSITSAVENVTINVTNTTTDITTGQVLTVSEMAVNNSIVGNVSTTGDSPVTFSIIAGNTGRAFAIDNAGKITVVDAVAIDYESLTHYTLTIEVTDGTTTDSHSVTINVTDENDYLVENRSDETDITPQNTTDETNTDNKSTGNSLGERNTNTPNEFEKIDEFLADKQTIVKPTSILSESDPETSSESEKPMIDEIQAEVSDDFAYVKPASRLDQWIESQLHTLNEIDLQLDESHDLFELSEMDGNEELWKNIDLMRDQMDADKEFLDKNDVEIEFVAAATVSFTAGFVSWVLRGGALLSSLLSSVSLFKQFDPMAVVFKKSNKRDNDHEDKQDKVEAMFDNDNKE